MKHYLITALQITLALVGMALALESVWHAVVSEDYQAATLSALAVVGAYALGARLETLSIKLDRKG